MISYTMKDLCVGDTRSITKAFSEADVSAFSEITGDKNPLHLDEDYAKTTIFKTRIVHGMLVSSLFSTIFGTIYPGLGTIYLFQSQKFIKPVYLNETVAAHITVKELVLEKNRVIFDCIITNDKGETVVMGEAILMPPKGSV